MSVKIEKDIRLVKVEHNCQTVKVYSENAGRVVVTQGGGGSAPASGPSFLKNVTSPMPEFEDINGIIYVYAVGESPFISTSGCVRRRVKNGPDAGAAKWSGVKPLTQFELEALNYV